MEAATAAVEEEEAGATEDTEQEEVSDAGGEDVGGEGKYTDEDGEGDKCFNPAENGEVWAVVVAKERAKEKEHASGGA
ncbi:hypothetical protein FACS189472_08910 [Alphaproteobacteria bacterium]|nr:hypothetical protein FACS189472_08910 [Alphaproteobacteria bacterium]